MSDAHQPDGGDRVGQEADSIINHAEDLKAARARQLELDAEQARLDDELAQLERRRDDLRRRREEVARAQDAALEREREDERLIREDLGDIDVALGGIAHPGPPPSHVHFDFYVDRKMYHTDQPGLTGRQIKAKVQDWDGSHDLMLEGIGSAEDRIVQDDELVVFDAAVTLHFSSVPKANFG